MQNMNWVDYIIIAIFFFSIVAGLGRGFVKEIISLATLIAAFVVASMFASPLAAAFTNSASVQNVTDQASTAIGMNAAQPLSYAALGLSFGLLFAATVIVGAIVGSIINLAFQVGILGIGNRILGGVFGFCRGFLINLVLIFLVQLTSFGSDPFWQQSQLVGSFQPAVQWLGNIVSPSLANLQQKFSGTMQNVTNTIQNMTR
jgi:membrane protein required for colicin V production